VAIAKVARFGREAANAVVGGGFYAERHRLLESRN
jgi:hypothetical protein